MSNIPFQKIDWALVEKVEYKGETGVAIWQTVQLVRLRIRLDGILQDVVQEQARRLGVEGVAQLQPPSEVKIVGRNMPEMRADESD